VYEFVVSFACNRFELAHFNKRIGEFIRTKRIRVNDDKSEDEHQGTAFIDSTA